MRRRGRDLKFRHHAIFNAPAPEWELGAVSVDDNGEHTCLWSSGGQHVVTGSTVEDSLAITFPAGVRYPKIASLPDGGFLVADTRVGIDLATGCRFPVSTWIFDVQGHLVCEGSLGDGIQDTLSTPTGQVWVGYFDEGVYGGGDTEHHGLVRFNPELEPTWLFPYGSEHGVIDDCYALNVFGETATFYFYSSFDIGQVRGDGMATWSGAPPGAHGLLVGGDRCVLVGGYEGRRDLVTHLRLAHGQAEIVGQGLITGIPEGERPHERICRGPDMHVIVGTDWFRASID